MNKKHQLKLISFDGQGNLVCPKQCYTFKSSGFCKHVLWAQRRLLKKLKNKMWEYKKLEKIVQRITGKQEVYNTVMLFYKQRFKHLYKKTNDLRRDNEM
jgi:hypothetical protein